MKVLVREPAMEFTGSCTIKSCDMNNDPDLHDIGLSASEWGRGCAVKHVINPYAMDIK